VTKKSQSEINLKNSGFSSGFKVGWTYRRVSFWGALRVPGGPRSKIAYRFLKLDFAVLKSC
jgi:hypothetical protein